MELKMKKYYVYNSLKDFLDDNDNYFVSYDLTQKDFETFEIKGNLVAGPITYLYINK